ncbi:MAG: hypothetical protein ABJF10_19445 [Chthoniobacter sp.]|uniref:hypothetical protein n=1 Tax=Chthoniobacter sp. TaxID=2510640 RepID=UPI0032AC2AF4
MDLKAFCALTGYSREHATRELSELRRATGLAFETKQRKKRGAEKASWGVIVADPDKLKFDKRSLFYDRCGNRLHNYTTLSSDGEKITPTIPASPVACRPRGRPRTRQVPDDAMKRPRGRPKKQSIPSPQAAPASVQAPGGGERGKKIGENHGLCDNAYEEDSFGIQQPDPNGARRDVAMSREEKKAPQAALKRKAFSLQARLEACHWDNCKVTFSSRTAHNYALRALVDGHAEERIVSCYADALFVCHGFAVDRSASAGKVVFFNPSSTVVKAAALLAKDGLTRQDRIARWYANHPRRKVEPPPPLPADIEAIRAQIAATFPRDEPPPSTKRQ